jgi:hypothetical protein
MFLVLQTQLENEESISDIVESVQKTVESLSSYMVPSLSESDSHELQSRIKDHISYAPYNFAFNVYLIICRKLDSIRASTAKWTKAEKNLPRRLLDARRVAAELESVMENIRKANELFIVRSFYQRSGIVPLISALDGDRSEHGQESQGNRGGRENS